jgi:hypothetical protein
VGSADEVLRKLIDELEKMGGLETSTIIISADHWWRGKSADAYPYVSDAEKKNSIISDIRIPFIVKMAGSKEPIKYQPEFNSVITRELIKAMIAGKVKTNADIGNFVDQLALEQPNIVGFRPQPRGN